MTNFTVGPTPLQVIGQGVDGGALTVQNTGPVSVYISGDPGVSTLAFEYKIDAGGDFIWPSGKPLSVCTGPGVIGQISFGGSGNVHVNSGSTNVTGAVTINGTVPITGPVTVSGTVALSGGVVSLSGPVSIAGGVSVSGSTINVGNAVALANIPVLIYNQNITVGAGAGTFSSLLSTSVLLSGYASIKIVISTTSTLGVLPVTVGNYISATVSCADVGGGGRSSVYNPQWLYVTQGSGPPNTPFQQSLQIPVTNTNMNLQVNVVKGAGNNGITNIQVYGMGQTIAIPQYISDGDGFVGTIPEGGLFYIRQAGVLNTNYFVGSKNGAAYFSVTNISGNTTIGSCYMTPGYVENGVIVISTLVPVPATAVTATNVASVAPMRPMALNIATNATIAIDCSVLQ